jgi:hypothetical protein
MPNNQGYQWRMPHRSLCVSRKGSIECCVAIVLFIKLTYIMGVSQQPPVAARGGSCTIWGTLYDFAANVEHVISVVLGSMPPWMEQPCNEAFQGSSP